MFRVLVSFILYFQRNLVHLKYIWCDFMICFKLDGLSFIHLNSFWPFGAFCVYLNGSNNIFGVKILQKILHSRTCVYNNYNVKQFVQQEFFLLNSAFVSHEAVAGLTCLPLMQTCFPHSADCTLSAPVLELRFGELNHVLGYSVA